GTSRACPTRRRAAQSRLEKTRAASRAARSDRPTTPWPELEVYSWLASPQPPKAPQAGGRRGKERAARHERSSDWRRGAAGSPDPDSQTPEPDTFDPDPDSQTPEPQSYLLVDD